MLDQPLSRMSIDDRWYKNAIIYCLDVEKYQDANGDERQKVFAAFGPEKRMQLYDRGIRRRLTPMLGNDRKRLELAFSLLFSLPGTPMMQYGDEIGIGDDLRLPERECARTPMQWTSERHGGFSRAKRVVRPVIDDRVYGYATVNVNDQRRDTESLLNWTERIIRTRKECPEISWGDFAALRTNVPEVLALRYDWRGTSLVTLHNFSDRRQRVRVKPGGANGHLLVEVFDGQHSRAHNDGAHHVLLGPYEWRWFRVGAADNVLNRSDLDLLPGAGGKPGAGPSQGAAAPRDSPAPCNLLPVESVA